MAGIVSDVCLKRKVRNFVEEFAPHHVDEDSNGYNIFIQSGPVIERAQMMQLRANRLHEDKDQMLKPP